MTASAPATTQGDTVIDLTNVPEGPEWLAKQRTAARERFEAQPWPNSKTDEFWRSTQFRKIAVDGDLVTPTVEIDLPKGSGVHALSLTKAVDHAKISPIVEGLLGSLTSDDDRTVTLNNAAWTEGVFVHVPKNVESDEPLRIRINVSQAGTQLPRVLIWAEVNSKATVIIEHTGSVAEGTALVSEVVEIIVEDGANLHVASTQEWDSTDNGTIQHLGLHAARLDRNATLNYTCVTLGGDLVRLRPETTLDGPGSEVFPQTVSYVDGGTHVDMQPLVRHIAPNATSDVLAKGAVAGRSKLIQRSSVFVGEKASGTSTDENMRALLLTDGARADSTPFLEIFNADIEAGHGSATGQLDGTQIFYLRSRGMELDDAIKLVVQGYFADVVSRIKHDEISTRLLDRIASKLDALDMGKMSLTRAAVPAID